LRQPNRLRWRSGSALVQVSWSNVFQLKLSSLLNFGCLMLFGIFLFLQIWYFDRIIIVSVLF
jgi:hypothetical protein